MIRRNVFEIVAVVLAAASFVACAPREARPANTTTTAAEVASAQSETGAPAATETAPVAEPVAAPAEKAAEPAGPAPVCRIKDDFGSVTELFLDWNGSVATGTLKTTAQSGEEHVQRLHAERADGLIVADDVAEPEDLVAHAALVKDHQGKRYIRLGAWNAPWKACE